MEYRTKQELIYQELYDGIVDGRYRPGERLDLDAIAERVGTSRTPVREAIRRLESEGLVTSVPHRGTVVSQLSIDEIAELYHIRAVLEGLAARLAAGNLTDADADGLRSLCQEMRSDAVRQGDEAFLELNRQFHEIIYRAAQAPLLHEYIINLYASTSRYRRLTASSPGRLDEILDEHEELARALIAGDAAEAERVSNLHHENNARTLSQLAGPIDELQELIP